MFANRLTFAQFHPQSGRTGGNFLQSGGKVSRVTVDHISQNNRFCQTSNFSKLNIVNASVQSVTITINSQLRTLSGYLSRMRECRSPRKWYWTIPPTQDGRLITGRYNLVNQRS